jgi:glycine/D-amino acid oxidase-like deaminating enzyme
MWSRLRSDSRVLVVGAGILGVSSAVHAARRGARVTIVTEGEVGNGASSRSLSWLNAAGIRVPEYHVLRVAGIDRYRTLGMDDRTRSWLRFDGGVMWGTPPETARYEEIIAFESDHGYEALWALPTDLQILTPGNQPGRRPAGRSHRQPRRRLGRPAVAHPTPPRRVLPARR